MPAEKTIVTEETALDVARRLEMKIHTLPKNDGAMAARVMITVMAAELVKVRWELQRLTELVRSMNSKLGFGDDR